MLQANEGWTQEQLYEQFEPLLDKVLHHRNFSSHHQDYRDWKHELYFKLYELACRFDGNPLQEPDRFRFVRFAMIGLDRYLLNLIRHQQLSPTCELSQEILATQVAPAASSAVAFFWQEALPRLNARDRQVVRMMLDEHLTQHQKALRLGVADRTYYQMRQQVMRKLQTIRETLVA